MSGLRLLLLFVILISLTQGFLFRRRRSRSRRRVRCSSKKDCVSCTSQRSWLPGKSCRWCPRDNKCRSYGSFWKNPCSRSQNIVSKGGCSNIIHSKYDRNLAYKMIFLSALSYADNVGKYIRKTAQVKTFYLVKQVTKRCSGSSRCSGFVAVSHTERAIAVAFRGSERDSQVIDQAIKILTQPKVSFPAGGKVQAYFNSAFRRIWNDLSSAVYKEIRKYPSYKVWVTGHSLGGALASLASTLLAYRGKTTKDKLILYTFGQPRVGNYRYALRHDKLVPISFRVTHYRDPVVHLPTCSKIAGLCASFTGGPYHHGKEIFYGAERMTKYSSYRECNGLPYNEDVKCSNNIRVWSKCITKLKKCIADHNYYFGVRVGLWWKSQ